MSVFCKSVRVAGALCAATVVASAQPSADALAFRNPDLPIEKRVDDLLSRLTIEEKVGQTMMASPEIKRLGIPKYVKDAAAASALAIKAGNDLCSGPTYQALTAALKRGLIKGCDGWSPQRKK